MANGAGLIIGVLSVQSCDATASIDALQGRCSQMSAAGHHRAFRFAFVY